MAETELVLLEGQTGSATVKTELKHSLDKGIKTRQRQILRTQVFIAAFFTIMCLAAGIFCVFATVRISQMRDDTEGEEMPNFCLSCEQLISGPFYDDIISTFDGSSEGQCCARNSTQLSMMLEFMLERRIQEEKAKGMLSRPPPVYVTSENGSTVLSQSKPAAHLIPRQVSEQEMRQGLNRRTGDSGMTPIKEWVVDKNKGLIQNGVDFQDGCLIVAQEGVYHLYTQAYFVDHHDEFYLDSERSPVLDEPACLKLCLYRYQLESGQEEQLACHTESQMVPRDRSLTENTLHVDTTLTLKSGDQLYVKTNNYRILSRNEDMTFFGLFLV